MNVSIQLTAIDSVTYGFEYSCTESNGSSREDFNLDTIRRAVQEALETEGWFVYSPETGKDWANISQHVRQPFVDLSIQMNDAGVDTWDWL